MDPYRDNNNYYDSSSSSDSEEQPYVFDNVAELEEKYNEENRSQEASQASQELAQTAAFEEEEKADLVIAIELNGGIDADGVGKKVCDANSRKYGLPSSKERRKVQNQINRWKNKQRHEFNSILLQQKQKNANAGKQKAGSATKKAASTPQLPPRSTRSTPVASTSSAQQPFHYQRSSPRPFSPSTPTMAAPNNFIATLLSQEYETIVVDLDYPERNNGPFTITYFPNHVNEETGTLHNAYHIELQDQDMQWMLTGETESVFLAYHIAPDKLFYKVPSGSFVFLKDSKADESAKSASGYKEPRSIEAYNVARNAIVNDPSRHFKYYLLKFPSNTPLDNSIFSPNTENGKLAVEVHPVISSFILPLSDSDDDDDDAEMGENWVQSYRSNIVWDIAIVEPFPRYTKSAKPRVNDTMASLRKNLKSMKLAK